MIGEMICIIIMAIAFILVFHFTIVPNIEENLRYEKALPELCTHPEFYYNHYTQCEELGVKP